MTLNRAVWVGCPMLLVAATLVAAPAETPVPLSFRRILAPSDDVKNWPLGSTRYVPVAPEEFERLVQTVGQAPVGARTSVAARVSQARYEVRFDGQDLLTGRGLFTITHTSKTPVLVPLEPLGLAVQSAHWLSEVKSNAAQGPSGDVVLGLATDGRMAVLVDRPGTLEVTWTLDGQRGPSGEVGFQLDLPRSPATGLQLDLPVEVVPSSSQGLLSLAGPASNGRQPWQIDLGGRHRTHLRLKAVAGDERGLNLLREAVTYEFTPRGVDVTAQLSLDVHHEPLRTVDLQLDSGLQMVAARYGDQAVPWSAVVDAENRTQRVVMELPEPVLGVGRVLRIAATAPLPTAPRWRLPGLAPQGVFWQEGIRTLLVPAPLVLEDLVPVGCRQSKLGRLSAPQTGESIELQCFAPGATAEVTIVERLADLRFSSGTTLLLGADAVAAEMIADFQVSFGERFSLEADVSPEWLIDSVESEPVGAVHDWKVTSNASSTVLMVRLSRAVRLDEPVRLRISGRSRLSPLGRALGAEQLRMAAFREASAARRIVAARAMGPYRIRLRDPEGRAQLDPQRLTGPQTDLLNMKPGDTLLDWTPAAIPWEMFLVEQPAQFTADIRCEVLATAGPVIESYRLRCVPDAAELQRILIHFSPARSDLLRWTVGREVTGPWNARRLADTEQTAAGIELGGETWEITIADPPSGAIELSATRETAWERDVAVSLASLPAARSQDGTLLVRTLDGTAIEVNSRRLKAVPAEPTPADRYSSVRAVYKYDPSRERLLSLGPAISISRVDAAHRPAGVLAWTCRIDSRYEPNGRALHQVEYRLENVGRPSCTLTVPAGCKSLGMWVDGNQVSGPSDAATLSAEFPAERRFSTITAQFESHDPVTLSLGEWRPPAWQIDVPVLSQQWRVCLPPGRDLVAGEWLSRSPYEVPMTLVQRLGSFCRRGGNRSPYDPFADPFPWLTSAARRKAAQDVAHEFLRRLGSVLHSEPDRATATPWQQTLSQVADSRSGAKLLLLVDQSSAHDISSAPMIASQSNNDDPQARALAWLEEARCAILIHDALLVVTSQITASQDRDQLMDLNSGHIFVVQPGPLAHELSEANRGRSMRYLPISAIPESFASPWPTSSVVEAPAGSRGWKVVEIQGGSEPVHLRIVNSSMLRTWAWGMFWLVAAVAWWTCRSWPAALMVMAGFACLWGLLALLLPAAYVPIPSGALLGSLLGLALGAVFPQRRSVADANQTVPISVNHLAVKPAAVGLIAAVTLAAGVSSVPAANPADEIETHRVFIPSDNKGRPIGHGYYQVPEAFYGELRRRALLATEEPQGWLLKSANYQGTLLRDAVQPRQALVELSLRIDFQVFTPDTRVRIPLGRDGANLLADFALLDGRATKVEWEEGGQALRCESLDPGDYRLQLLLRPAVRVTGDLTGFEFSIPPLANSKLQLSLPVDAPAVDVPLAAGAVRWSEDRQQLSAELGPTDRLAVRWSEMGSHNGPAPVVDAEELLWLRVRPGSVVVDARFKYQVMQGQLREIELLADPRLRLLPVAGPESPVAAVRTMPVSAALAAPLQTIRLELHKPATDQVVVQVSFLVTGNSGVGQLRLPWLESHGIRTARRWLAVSVDPSLQFEPRLDGPLEAEPIPEFAARWAQPDPPPQLAYRWPRGESHWSLATRPLDARTSAVQTLALSCGRGRAAVRFDADLDTRVGSSFRYRLQAPTALEVESVSVLEEGAQRAARWARDEQGSVVVFLTGPVTGAQRLALRGTLPLPSVGKVSLPILSVDKVEIVESKVQIYRQPGVIVAVEDVEKLVRDQDLPPADAAPDWGRPVEQLVANGDGPSAWLAIERNQPQVKGVQVTRLEREGQAWTCEVDFQFHVVDGLLDVLRFELPAGWNEPFELSPMSSQEVVAVGEDHRQLVIRPRSAIQGDYRLTLHATLSSTAGEHPAVPNIVPVVVDRVDRYFVVPNQVGVEQAAWDTHHLRPAALPGGFAVTGAAPESLDVYRVMGEHPRAILRSMQTVSNKAVVHLADVHVAWQLDGAYRGVVTFDVEPAGARNCALKVPEGCRLVRAWVEGSPVLPKPQQDRIWHVHLGAQRLPQRLEVVFQGHASVRGHSVPTVELFAPSLGNLPVERTLWTLYPPAGAGETQLVDAVERDVLATQLDRARSLVSLLDAAQANARELHPEDLERWSVPWIERLVRVRRDLQKALADYPSAETQRAAQLAIDQLDRMPTELNGRLSLINANATAGDGREANELLSWGYRGSWHVIHLSQTGGTKSVTIRSSDMVQKDWHLRLIAAAACLAMGASLWWLGRRDTFGEWLRRWPHAVGLSAGVAWWLWLEPSFAGWIVIAVSLLSGMRSGWATVREPASTSNRVMIRSAGN